jgi:molybdopterin-guanine dinucleotide biosynthesis protein A
VSVCAAVIAGGKAERLGGQPKGLLVVGGRRILDRQLEVLRAQFGRVFLVANDPTPWGDLALEIVPDRISGAGPLAGLDAALGALAPDEDAAVCVAGDMPFLDAGALALLRDHPLADAVVPRIGGRPEPLFARYARGCLPAIQRALAEGRLKTQALLAELDAAYLDEPALRAIDPTLRFLTNVNTPEDLSRL